MHRILGAFCFLPIIVVSWSWLLSRLASLDEVGGAIPYLSLLTVAWLALRLRSTEKCLSWLVVQLVVAFLFSIPAGRVSSSRKYGQLTACKSNLKNLATALEIYSDDHQGALPAELGQLVPAYLKVIPNCPGVQADTYSLTYFRRGEHFTLGCDGANHLRANSPAGYPRYTSREGLIER